MRCPLPERLLSPKRIKEARDALRGAYSKALAAYDQWSSQGGKAALLKAAEAAQTALISALVRVPRGHTALEVVAFYGLLGGSAPPAEADAAGDMAAAARLAVWKAVHIE